MAPLRARSFFARFVAAFAAGRHDEAFASARAALAFNGNSTLFARTIGAAHVLRGDVDAGLALLRPLTERGDDRSAALGAQALALALSGDKEQAGHVLARAGASESALALIVQLSLCEDAACARGPLADLRRNFPGVAADIDAALDRMGMAPAVKARLLPGLRASGALSAPPANPG